MCSSRKKKHSHSYFTDLKATTVQTTCCLYFSVHLHYTTLFTALLKKQMLYLSYNLNFTPCFLLIRGPSGAPNLLITMVTGQTVTQPKSLTRCWADQREKGGRGKKRGEGGKWEEGVKWWSVEKIWNLNVPWANGKWLFHGDCLMIVRFWIVIINY